MCYHGGQCVPGLSDKYGNDQLFCDCTSAIASDGTQYVGKYCETPFEQLCDQSGDTFCVNGGECNPSYPNFDANPCTCEDGWEGFHCEFKMGTVPDCTLDCKNDGRCVVGIQDPAEAERMHHIWTKQEGDDHMRCLCSPDYGGPLCESSAEDCGGDACYHGGSCVETTIVDNGVTTSEFHCDCTTAADNGKLYAGKYCEEESTSICSQTDENLFCTNDSKCKDNPLEGCECPEDYFGFKCEYQRDSYDKEAEPEECGEYYCLNNGKCAETTITLSDGSVSTEKACDCSTAFDGEFHYGGSACQYQSTSTCDDNLQCFHNSTCPVSSSDDGCSCPDGWKGASCEIHIYALEDEFPNDPQCGGRVCLNGGKCIQTEIVKSADLTENLFHCDCSSAYDGKHHFAGESCQFPSTHVCTLDEKVEDRLFCTNSGVCDTENPKQGCGCPDGFEGFSCEFENVKEKPKQVDSTGLQICGDMVCQNGGKCITSLIYDPAGDTKTEIQHCDCGSTHTSKTAFAGDQCQYEATRFCNKPLEGDGMESDLFFCVNDGLCADHIRDGCICGKGWSGPSCQFAEEVSDIVDDNNDDGETCGDLTCRNGGTCESIEETNTNTGDKTTVYRCNCASITNGLFAGTQCEYPSSEECSTDNPSGSFCVNGGKCKGGPLDGCECKAGWEGALCESPVKDDSHASQGEACGAGYCYNNGVCVQTKITKNDGTEVTEFHCDCYSAFDDTNRYGGLSCEHESTSFCARSNQGESLQGVSFCANGGVCSDNPLQGCDCPAGFTGFSCEFQTADDDNAGDNSNVDQCDDQLVCLNNGKCSTSTVTDSSGKQTELKHCDCSTAIVGDDVFAGKQCEFKQTSFCSKPKEGQDLSTSNFCVNGGECQENVLSGCDCRDGFEGFRCEYEKDSKDLIEVADEPKLVDNYVECSDFYCYNGSTCISSVTDGGQTEYKCSCDTAATGSTLFAGNYCQYESTSLCTKGTLNSLNGADFCVNNGKCPEGEGDGGCDCPAGYSGFRCDEPLYFGEDTEDNIAPNLSEDFEDDDDAADFFQCRLKCENGGVCAKGAKDMSHLHGQFDHVSHLNQTFDQTYFEHCICKEGWFGLECEHKAEVCGADEHLCLHGSKCVKNNQQHGCDCSKTDEMVGDSTVFAGDSCEHPATDICIYGNEYPGRPLYFCTNQGKCSDYVSPNDPDPGCECPPEWKGPHCEVRVDFIRVSEPASGNGGLFALGGILLLAAAAAFAYLMVYRRPSKDPSASCMPFRRRLNLNYDPNDDSNNLAPKRASGFTPPNDMNPPPSRTFSFKSGSDPLTAFELPPDNEPQPYRDEPDTPTREPFQDEPDDEPEDEPAVLLNVGPTRDEDGNQLHNVDFV